MSRFSRLVNLWRHRALDAEFDDELTFHFEMRVEKNLRRGMTRAEAELDARRHLGSTLRAKEGMREARVMMWIETLFRDLAYGARMFRRQPGTTLLAVLTLSLGIGANTVIFSLLHATLLRPLPFPSADRLVAVVDNFRADGAVNVPPTVPELLDVRAASRTLDPISFFDMRDAQINGGTEPARAWSARIESEFFRTLGVQPALGRLFAPDDHESGRDRVVILSDSFWRRNFGADPGAVDRGIVVNGVPHTVVGVLPPGVTFDFFSAEPIELYVPFPMGPIYTLRTGEFANVRRVTAAIARLKPDATIDSATAELLTVSERLRASYTSLYRRGSDGQDLGFSMGVTPLRELVVGNTRPIVVMLFTAVGLVLLIACVNTVQFLLARAVERQPEVLIRTALGAGRVRLLRQFLTEALLLATIAAALGLLQAGFLIDLVRVMIAFPSPLLAQISINPAVVGFTLAVTAIVTLACGLLPALHLVGGRFIADTARLAGAARSRARHVMITAQVALATVLLISAGLLAQGLQHLQNLPRGYNADDVTVMRMRVAGRVGQGGTGAIYQEYLRHVAAIPGMAQAAVTDSPLPGSPVVEFAIMGRPDDAAALTMQRASWRIVSGSYFELLGIPILTGRSFEDRDSASSPPVTIINEDMARRFWPDQNPIGQQIRTGGGPRSRVATIVGIVGNVRPPHHLETAPQLYMSYLQQSEPNITLLVRPSPGTTVSADTIKQAVWSVVPEQPLYDIRPFEEVIARSMGTPRLITRLLSSFAALALIMSALGVYTIVSYLTARRTKEVALRRAIGATPGDVLRLLGLPTLRWTAIGLILGLVAAAGTTRALSSMAGQFNMPQGAILLGPSMVFLTSVLYMIVVGVAVLVPASRALRVQPSTILRAE
jgi:putative ABC transport system permease protein